ncbi:phage virion morphogenesis protein [Xenorhabdus ehlersii]|uniref:Phage morphogeneis protein n=1 Tax=Xenorhabdus ehlersii TaxID=290111 RepID=A0A2D0IRX0_9GAMM|nr:phage virion morphogenesis protein [Xenorhabdus ehlersii]PHM24591.1 phage morphogeneis protein [Xenorhabdus ehlersii]RKE91230.1 phage virion morphogenesis protein [Xenorhabdus ehlersii]
MSNITITINDNDLMRGLHALASSAEDLTPAMRKIAATLSAETSFNFEADGRPAWIPSVAAQDRSGQTLQKTGRLMNSINTRYDSSSAVIGTNIIYARIHQMGGETGRNKSISLPARPYLPVTAEDELSPEATRSVLSAIQRHLEAAARR